MRSEVPSRTIETEIVDYFIFNAEDVDVGAFSRAKTDEVAAHFGIDPKIAYRTLDALAQQGVLLKTRDIMKRHRGRTAVGYQWWEYSWRPGDLERYKERERSRGRVGSTVQERQMPRELSAEEWRAVLLSLAAKIPPTIDPPHVTLIGGVAMVLGYNSRRPTNDADVIMTPDVAAEVLPAADQVAAQYGLSPDGHQNRLQFVRTQSRPRAYRVEKHPGDLLMRCASIVDTRRVGAWVACAALVDIAEDVEDTLVHRPWRVPSCRLDDRST